jgi:hypothetical protein
MDYGLPKADQLPMLPVARIGPPSVVNDLGIKGVGESGAIPGAAAIANAVEDAVADLGVTIREGARDRPPGSSRYSRRRAPGEADRGAPSADRAGATRRRSSTAHEQHAEGRSSA